MAKSHEVVIIGGGHNGLTVAGYLAKAGVDVCVVEALPKVGGGVITIEPVAPGDTIRVKLSVKRKVKKAPRPDEQATGVVVWAIEVTNQNQEPVAVYDILTLVAQRDA